MSSALAFIFPGQGSQALHMLAELGEQFPLVRDTFSIASECLGYDLWALTQNGPTEVLNQTEKTQPVLLAASVALWRLWQRLGGALPVYLAGHSLGEYSAYVCAGALDFRAAVILVALRGRFMQEAVPEGKGAMAAIIGLDNQKVADICQKTAQDEVLSPANFNAIGQVVIAGEQAAVTRAMVLAKQSGAKIVQSIPVSVPSHCMLMKPAADRLAEALEQMTITPPKIPVVTNVDVICYDDPQAIRSALVRQLYYPVRWVECMQYVYEAGVRQVIECGPGKVLTGLNKRIHSELVTTPINTPVSVQQALALILAI